MQGLSEWGRHPDSRRTAAAGTHEVKDARKVWCRQRGKQASSSDSQHRGRGREAAATTYFTAERMTTHSTYVTLKQVLEKKGEKISSNE